MAALSSLVCVATVTPASAALLTNGGFESDVGLTGNSWSVFKSIDGWQSDGGPGIEIQRGNVGGTTAFAGHQKVELDSHGGKDTNSHMYQNVTLGAGKYEFSFEYFARIADANSNGIGYSIAPVVGSLVGDIARSYSGNWITVSNFFTLDAETEVTVRFWADGKDDTLGGYLDNVSISAVPLPPSVLLFGASLLGLGWLGRRRRKANIAV